MVRWYSELSALAKAVWAVMGAMLTIAAMIGVFAAFEQHNASAKELAAFDESIHKELAAELARRDTDIQYVAQTLQIINRDMIIRQITAYSNQIAIIQNSAAGRALTPNEQGTIRMLQNEIQRLQMELRK